MKLQTLYALLFIATVSILASCNDTLNKVGFSIQPGDDRVSVGVDTLLLTSRTVQVDSVFSRTKYPILGEYIDPVFGSIKSGYVGEFYYPEEQQFREGAIVDSVRLAVSYASMIGDSLAPMRLAVYEVVKELPQNKDYTNFDPKTHVDMTAPLGAQNFTGRNKTYHIKRIYESGAYKNIKVYEILTTLPKTIGQNFLDEYRKPDRGALKNTDTFRKYFPGLYVTTNFGNSTVLNVNLTSLQVHYKYLDKGGSSTKKDTIRTDEFRLNITPEVTQINYIKNKNEQLLQPNGKGTYVKSPAGVNTEVTIPVSKIYNNLKTRSLNQARLVVYALPEANQGETVKLSPPDYLLLVNKDSLQNFFENRRLQDNVTSFYATFNPETYSYNFGNIAAMINYYKGQKKEAFDLTYCLVPVDITFVKDQYGNTKTTAVYNKMKPTAAMLENKPEKLKLDIIYSSF